MVSARRYVWNGPELFHVGKPDPDGFVLANELLQRYVQSGGYIRLVKMAHKAGVCTRNGSQRNVCKLSEFVLDSAAMPCAMTSLW
jgi:hypothetical protein